MAIVKADKIISADIVHTDSGMLGGKPPGYYARSDHAMLPWQADRTYVVNDLCYLNGIIYRSQIDNNRQPITEATAWKEYAGGGVTEVLEMVLTANGWVNQDVESSPYSVFAQILNVPGVSNNTIGEMGVSDSATYEQYMVAQEADMRKIGQETGAIIINAYGEQPELDIPISIVIYK